MAAAAGRSGAAALVGAGRPPTLAGAGGAALTMPFDAIGRTGEAGTAEAAAGAGRAGLLSGINVGVVALQFLS